MKGGSDGRNTVQHQADQCVRVPYAEVAAMLFSFCFLGFKPSYPSGALLSRCLFFF